MMEGAVVKGKIALIGVLIVLGVAGPVAPTVFNPSEKGKTTNKSVVKSGKSLIEDADGSDQPPNMDPKSATRPERIISTYNDMWGNPQELCFRIIMIELI